MPANQELSQDIEFARISQEISVRFYNQSAIAEPTETPLWVRSGHPRT